MYENVTRSLNKNQQFQPQFFQQMTGLTRSAKGSCCWKGSSLSDAHPGDSQIKKKHMTAICYQITPGQDGDEMAGYQLTGQDACLQVPEGGHPPLLLLPD